MSLFLIDQHVHLNYDDAKHGIEYVANSAAEQGIVSLGPVVHDYVGHMQHSVEVAKACGIPYPLALTELTAHDGHYLMIFPDFRSASDKEFTQRLQKIYKGRREKLRLLAESTQKKPFIMLIKGIGEVDFSFTMKDLEEISSGGRLLSGHLSQLLSNLTGGQIYGTKAYHELQGLFAMDEYRSSAPYVESLFCMDELVYYAKRFGAKLIEAHPPDADWSRLCKKLRAGLDGFELSAKYRSKEYAQVNRDLLMLSGIHGFLLTFGTDNHLWEDKILGYQNRRPEISGEIDFKQSLERLLEELRPDYI